MNGFGHPVAAFPVEELETRLALPSGSLAGSLVHSWVRTASVGGFHSRLGFPHQQRSAIAAGSVFVFDLGRTSVTTSLLAALERDGLGLRRHLGYGRVALNLHGEAGRRDLSSSSRTEIERRGGRIMERDLDLSMDKNLINVLSRVYEIRTRDALAVEAVKMADGAENIPTSSALQRIAVLLGTRMSMPEVKAEIARFRKALGEKLRKCRVPQDGDPGARKETLGSLLDDWIDNPVKSHVVLRHQLACVSKGLIGYFTEDAREQLVGVIKPGPLALHFLLTLVKALIWRNR